MDLCCFLNLVETFFCLIQPQPVGHRLATISNLRKWRKTLLYFNLYLSIYCITLSKPRTQFGGVKLQVMPTGQLRPGAFMFFSSHPGTHKNQRTERSLLSMRCGGCGLKYKVLISSAVRSLRCDRQFCNNNVMIGRNQALWPVRYGDLIGRDL